MVKSFRDPLSGLTHFIGMLFSIYGLIALLTRSVGENSTYHTVSFSIFGGAMILLYTFSTLYHWLPLEGEKLLLFRKIDHIMIFVFIAASNTPICLISIRGVWGWSVFASVWAFTLGGFFLKIFWLNAPRYLYTAIYLIMGWMIVAAIYPLSKIMQLEGILLLALGGVFYSIGAVIYAMKKPDPFPNKFGFHEIFHLFIMAGSLCHFLMVYYYI